MHRVLITPSEEAITAVIDSAIIPLLIGLEQELGCALSTTAAVEVNGLSGSKRNIEYSGLAESGCMVIPGEIRLRFRETYVEGRLVFHAEAVYNKMHPDNFSGFTLKGEVLTKENPIIVKYKAWTKQHNIWEFEGWI